VEHPRSAYDWLNRDNRAVDAYVSDPLCGFIPTAGLLRDMLLGMLYNQRRESLQSMRKDLPVLFIAGGEDPVGNYGKSVRQTEQMFIKSGMQKVSCKIYPLMRHEILNELNHEEVYQDVGRWLAELL
jgi:alpha-beta hydrolase superfamily lysophospholipase